MKVLRQLSTLLVLGFVFLGSCKKEEAIDYDSIDAQIIADYLKENNLTAESTSSGLHYIIDTPGTGQKPSNFSYVKMKYRGYLTNGKIFDEATSPVTFRLDQLIQGWQEGIPKFKEGGKGKLLVPSSLGYGSRQTGDIPAHSVLIFDIELEEVL